MIDAVEKYLAISGMIHGSDDELIYLGLKALWPLCDPDELLNNEKKMTMWRADMVIKSMINMLVDECVQEASRIADQALSILNQITNERITGKVDSDDKI